MEFKINDRGETIRNIVRKIGYVLQDVVGDNGQYSLVREINKGSRYPRFHIYLKKDSSPTNFNLGSEGDKNMFEKEKNTPKLVGDKENKWFVFDLHLDQKSASYEKSKTHAHSGEYAGSIIEEEKDRVEKLLRE